MKSAAMKNAAMINAADRRSAACSRIECWAVIAAALRPVAASIARVRRLGLAAAMAARAVTAMLIPWTLRPPFAAAGTTVVAFAAPTVGAMSLATMSLAAMTFAAV